VGEPLPEEAVEALRLLPEALNNRLGGRLAELLTRAEVRALKDRVSQLLADPVFPMPSSDWRAIPWPAF
jgi:hypothetical protein